MNVSVFLTQWSAWIHHMFSTLTHKRQDFDGKSKINSTESMFNRLMPNDCYMGRTAPLTSKSCILYIYSTNIRTEYFKHALHSPVFFSSKCSLFHTANFFGSCIIHILYTGVLKLKKKNNSVAKGLINYLTGNGRFNTTLSS